MDEHDPVVLFHDLFVGLCFRFIADLESLSAILMIILAVCDVIKW
jgi:hypothetical protein